MHRDNIDHLAVGAALLGSGGGGEPSTFVSILKRRLGDREIRLHQPADLPAALVAPVGLVGGTSVLIEKLPSGPEWRRAVEAVNRWSGQQVTCVMGMEVAGLNALTGLVVALDLGLPYLDADLMGRALPRMDQFSWSVAGLRSSPMAIAQANGQVVLVEDGTPEELERTVRALVAMVGGWAAAAVCPTPVMQAAPASILGGVQRALELGAAHASLSDNPSPSEVAAALGGRVLGAGRVRMVQRESHSSGFGRGAVTIVDKSDGTVVRLEAENEFILALADGEVVATCPDLLCLLQARTALPVSVDRVQIGDDAVVLALPGPQWWMAQERIAAVAPRAFGLNSPPVVLQPT